MGPQFLFMDDNAPCNRTVAAEQLLESEDIERMDWPARSPDLNPIEHVWDFLGRRLAARTLPPVTIPELRLALQDEWAVMPQQLMDTLILSMARRCETCLAVKGDQNASHPYAWNEDEKVCRDSKRFVMASKYHLEESVKWRIIGRLEAGQSIMETATCLNISRQTVSKLWKQFQNDGSVVRRPGQGRKRMTTASEDRYLALTARRNRKATARQLSSELAAATGTVASRQTIYRRLNEKGLYARKPRVCVLLSSQKKRDRFNWCKEHQNWTEHQWSHVLFTDESRFSLTGDSKRVYIWRESGTRNDPSNIVERNGFGSIGMMVWGGIMIDGRTPLHVFSSG
ncbi:Transposable element Tcb2 transposase, partial [Stegodyphus mimosarum]